MTELNPEALEKAVVTFDAEFNGTYSGAALVASCIRTYLASLPPVDAEPVGYVTQDAIDEVAAGRIGNHLFPKGCLRPENEIPLYTTAAIIALQGERDGPEREVETFWRPEFKASMKRAEAAEAEVARLKDELAQKEEERAEQWRQRREAQGSRDATKAACDSLRLELAEAHLVIEPFAKAADNFDDFKIANPNEWFAYGGISSANSDREGAITVGDLRRARSFRDGQKTGEKG